VFCASRRTVLRAVLPALISALVLTLSSGPAAASSAGDIVSYTNSARADHGVGRLSVASDLTQLAQQHASWMASHRTLQHTSDLGGTVCCWSSVGENVGYGGSARQVFDAFMGSAEHRANILTGRYTQIGVGVARASNGYVYVDQIFRKPNGSAGSTTRASRSGTRAPLHLALAPRAAAPSAEQVRRAQLAVRIARLRPAAGSDPIRRSVLWVVAMSKVTAR
jgi:hypothetical protein